MNFLPLIEAKRDGTALTPAQLAEAVAAFTAGRIPDYQMAAFLMAVFFQGMTPGERRALTLAMRDSGESLQFPPDARPLVDKHSTGGVGDKVSLPLAPLLACLGLRVPMISGRGLGITGGTLDKLESIPGFSTELSPDRITELVQTVGCVICGQTGTMVPADRRLYALRDVSGTVPSLPLITASILSKKLAESLQALVLDVKFGVAAFMPTRVQARELASAMVTLGSECGVSTRAVLTAMDAPVGRSAGNWLEVKEAVNCLTPARAADTPADLRRLVLEFAAHLLVQTGLAASVESGLAQTEACLASGAPLRKWEEMLAAQGADVPACQQLLARDSTAAVVQSLPADRTGYVTRCDARLIGEVVRDLGAGRLTHETVIQPAVGVDGLVKPGEAVSAGNPLVRIHARNVADAETARVRLAAAFAIEDAPPASVPLIAEVIG
jgi:pyrimidine-nucleoside phosphorylase